MTLPVNQRDNDTVFDGLKALVRHDRATHLLQTVYWHGGGATMGATAGMNRTFKAAVAALVLAVGFAGSVAAGTFEDAVAAYEREEYATALRLLRPLADQGSAEAQLKLGTMYDEGWGVSQDHAAALRWYRKAADQSNAPAQYILGAVYLDGVFVPQDYAVAASWFRKAADQGIDGAQYHLGNMYFYGRSVLQDDVAAVGWYRKAAYQGYAPAQFNLGGMYYKGRGVPQDYVTAHMWFNLAAAGGRKDAVKVRDMLAAMMTPAQIAEAQKLAREWKPK
jgi:TPR repeat protein